MTPLTLGLIALIVLVGIGMILALVLGGGQADKNRNLAVIRGRSASAAFEDDKNNQDKRRASIAKKLKEQGNEEEKQKKNTIATMIEQAGLSISVTQFWLFSLAFGIASALAAKLFNLQPLVIGFIFITGFLGFPKFFLNGKIKSRQKKFLEEFADALEAMVRLLKAGMPVTEAISMAGREFGGPVGEEMTRIYEAQKVGIPLPEAALAAAQRMPLTEMQMFATGVAIQAQTGASLSEVLMNLAGVIRARHRLKRKVLALSSEAKASAMIIGSLPFLVGGGLFFINPEYIGILFDTLPGRIMMAASAVWMGIGILIMRAMINFKV